MEEAECFFLHTKGDHHNPELRKRPQCHNLLKIPLCTCPQPRDDHRATTDDKHAGQFMIAIANQDVNPGGHEGGRVY